MYDLIIIGGGPAGITAGIYAARKKLNTVLITKEWGGQMTDASEIENWPGNKNISGMDLMNQMKEHLKGFEIEIKEDREVINLEKKNNGFVIRDDKDEEYEAKTVIIATGKIPRALDIPGEKEFKGKGVSICSTCLPPGEKIVVNSSLRNIENIDSSQKVLTINGTFQKIKEIVNFDYKGEIIKIKTRFFTDPVRLTPEHPVLRTRIEKGNGVNYYRDFKIKEPEWIKAGRLIKDDVLLYPIILKTKDIEKIDLSKILDVKLDKGRVFAKKRTHTSLEIPNKIPISKDFLRLAGYFISEGSITMYGINFYFSKKEKEYIEDTKNLVKKIFHLNAVLKNENNVTRVQVYSTIVRDLFQLLFGKYAYNKKLPNWTLFLPLEKQGALIKGIYRGDGCKREKDFCIVTNSETLTYQLRDIFLRLGIIPCIHKREKSKLNKKPGKIEGREIRFNHDRYHIIIGGPSLEKMSKILGICHEKINRRTRIRKHAWIKDNYLYLPIRFINRSKHKGKVYSLLVEGNNTYVTKNFIVHNCDAPLFKDKQVAIIGGGNAGFSMALDLSKYAKGVTILEFLEKTRGDEVVKDKLEESNKVEILTNVAVKEIKGTQFVEKLIYENRDTGKDTELKIKGVFIAIGMMPKAGFAEDLVEFNEVGEIKIDKENNTKTPGLFAAGDITDVKYEQIVIAASEGAKSALSASEYLKKAPK